MMLNVRRILSVITPLCVLVSLGSAAPIVIDDGDTGYAESGSWWHGTGQGYQNDIAGDADLGGYATYTFTGLTAGDYNIWATYVNAGNRSQFVPYSIYDGTDSGGTLLASIPVDQKYTAPSGLTYDGAEWDQLSDSGDDTFTITGSTLTVRIDVAEQGQFSMADGVMIELVPEPASLALLMCGVPFLLRRRR